MTLGRLLRRCLSSINTNRGEKTITLQLQKTEVLLNADLVEKSRSHPRFLMFRIFFDYLPESEGIVVLQIVLCSLALLATFLLSLNGPFIS